MRVALLTMCLTGCVGATTLNGARPNAPGETTLHTGTSTPGVVSLQLRHGVAPDVDLGFTARNGILGVDIRARVIRTRRLHVAIQPSLMGGLTNYVFSEADFGLRGAGAFGVTLPVLTEVELTRHTAVTVAPALTVGNRFVLASAEGDFYTQDTTWARVQPSLGWRVTQDIGRVRVGVSLDLRFRRHSLRSSLQPFPQGQRRDRTRRHGVFPGTRIPWNLRPRFPGGSHH